MDIDLLIKQTQLGKLRPCRCFYKSNQRYRCNGDIKAGDSHKNMMEHHTGRMYEIFECKSLSADTSQHDELITVAREIRTRCILQIAHPSVRVSKAHVDLH